MNNLRAKRAGSLIPHLQFSTPKKLLNFPRRTEKSFVDFTLSSTSSTSSTSPSLTFETFI